MDRYAIHRQRVYAFLKARGPLGATTDELSDPTIGGHEGPRRVRELREDGLPISTWPEPTGYWRYVLGTSRQMELFDDDE
jgi:hypothetical protein